VVGSFSSGRVGVLVVGGRRWSRPGCVGRGSGVGRWSRRVCGPCRCGVGGCCLSHWTDDHWDELIRHLGLYPEADDDPVAQARRADAAAVQDYRRRFRQVMSAGLQPLVPAAASRDGESFTADAATLAATLAHSGDRMLLLGASGDGKTHLAKHAALRLTEQGQMVIWVAADDYEKGRFGRSLARTVGPFSTEEAKTLLRKAADGGAGVTVIIDGLETSRHREELLTQLGALVLQTPATVLVTAARDDGTELLATATRIELASPTADERTQLATAYGTAHGVAEASPRDYWSTSTSRAAPDRSTSSSSPTGAAWWWS
jgi:hypothetical protein